MQILPGMAHGICGGDVGRIGGAMYQRFREMYSYYYPFSGKTCKKNAAFSVGAVLLVGVAAGGFLFLRKEGDRAWVLPLFFLYFVYREVFYLQLGHEARKDKDIFCKVLMNMGHQYYRSGQVAEAVYDAAEGMPPETKKNLRRIYEILGEKDRQSGMEAYKKQVKNRFYRTFLMQAAAVEEHGDERMGEGSSVFLWSLKSLRVEAEIEQRNEQRMRYLLSGLGFVVAVPMFTIPAIHRWAVGNLEELSAFYDGIKGKSLELLAYGLTFFLYEFLNGLRGIPYRPALGGWIRWMGGWQAYQDFFGKCQKVFGKKFKKREEMLKRWGNQKTVQEFFLKQLLGAVAAVVLGICIYILYLRYGVGKHPAWVVFFALAAYAGFQYPVVRLFMERLVCLDKRKEEVLRLQFLIRLEKQLPGMTCFELLGHLEQNAQLFRPALQECIGDYEWNENEALLALWQKEKEPSFRKLVDMFVMAEEIGVEDAFREIDAEIEQFLENQKLETEIMQQRRADFAVLLACAPGILLLFGYLILPFMAECFRMLAYYNGSLTAM